MCSIIGMGERLHEVLEQIDLGKLDSGEQSLPFALRVWLKHYPGMTLLNVHELRYCSYAKF